MPTDQPDPAPGDSFAVLSCLTPHWQVSSRVSAFCTTRTGGVSEAPFDALNLGLHVGDDEHAVIENRRRLQDSFALPGPPHWLHQTHSADVADLAVAVDDTKVCADGAWTNEPGKVLAVLTADCLPVVISDTQGTELAVVHAGWRG
ncbi:MAG: hypothetical protein HKN42_14775, partial [Granulosicoccus sp.]|nr:hypothetical protein [Granulosicoccus sp.]